MRKSKKAVIYPRAHNPLLKGEWDNIKTGEVIVNKHALYEVYGKRTSKTLEFFTELHEMLHHVAEQRGAKQDIIITEQTEVTFICPSPFQLNLLRRTRELEKTVKEMKNRT